MQRRSIIKNNINSLRRFKRKIVKRIHVREEDEWRPRKNKQIEELIKNVDIVRRNRSLRKSWLGRVKRMEEGEENQDRDVCMTHKMIEGGQKWKELSREGQ